jgi:hypothetical protein
VLFTLKSLRVLLIVSLLKLIMRHNSMAVKTVATRRQSTATQFSAVVFLGVFGAR